MPIELIKTVIICGTVIISLAIIGWTVRSMFASQAKGILDAFRSQVGVLNAQQQPMTTAVEREQAVRRIVRERANGNDVRPVPANAE